MEGSKKCAEYLLTKNVKRCMNEIKSDGFLMADLQEK